VIRASTRTHNAITLRDMKSRALLAFLLALAGASTAHAQCTVTAHGDAAAIGFAQSLAASSDNATVRAAYAAHHCNIRKLMHGGGRACRWGIPLDHVTIRVFATGTFHVFPARLADGWFCTTEGGE
jgi:hypothetical protein